MKSTKSPYPAGGLGRHLSCQRPQPQRSGWWLRSLERKEPPISRPPPSQSWSRPTTVASSACDPPQLLMPTSERDTSRSPSSHQARRSLPRPFAKSTGYDRPVICSGVSSRGRTMPVAILRTAWPSDLGGVPVTRSAPPVGRYTVGSCAEVQQFGPFAEHSQWRPRIRTNSARFEATAPPWP